MAAVAISSSSATIRIGCKKSAFVSNASTSVRSEFVGLRRMDSMFDMVSSHCLFAQMQRNVQAVGNGCHGVVTTAGAGKFFVGGNGKCNEEKQEAENAHLSGLRHYLSGLRHYQRDWGLLNRHYFVDECLTFEAADEVNQQELNPSRRRRCLKLHSSKTSSEITASFSLFLKTIAGSSLCMQVQGSHSVSELKTQIHQATGIPPRFQQLIFEGRQLGDDSLLRDYGNLKNATISLTSRLRGGAPSVTHPSSYKQAVNSGTSAPSKLQAETSKVKEPFGGAFIVEQCAEPPTAEVEDPQVYGYAFLYQTKALICRFNGLWPSAPALKEWVNKTWSEGHELFFCSKGFFIVNFSTEAECQRILEQGPWFWGRSGLSMQRWFPEFNPLTMTAMTTPVWVRLPNLPLHFYSASFLPTLGNALGRFIKIDTDRITKGFITFARICVEIDLSQGLPDRILIDWGDGDPFIQMVDYENTAFRCRSCQQTGHLQATCPLSPTPPTTSGARKRANGWQGPKSHKSRPIPSFDNKQHPKNAPTPSPSSMPSQTPTFDQQPHVDPKHQPVASVQNPVVSEAMTPSPATNSLHPPHDKGETTDTNMISASLPGTQKRPHESDNSDSDKEAPRNSAAQDFGTSSDHLALVVKAAEPTSSSGWIDVRKKKGRKDPHWQTQ